MKGKIHGSHIFQEACHSSHSHMSFLTQVHKFTTYAYHLKNKKKKKKT